LMRVPRLHWRPFPRRCDCGDRHIALWDLHGKQRGGCDSRLVGSDGGMQRCQGICQACLPPHWMSALPLSRREVCCRASRVSNLPLQSVTQGITAEMAALRRALGPDAQIMVDLHWKFTGRRGAGVDRGARAISAGFRRGSRQTRRSRRPCPCLHAIVQYLSLPAKKWYTAYEAATRLEAGTVRFSAARDGPHTGINPIPPHRPACGGNTAP